MRPSFDTAPAAAATVRQRHEVPVQQTWNLADVFPDWAAWEHAGRELAFLLQGRQVGLEQVQAGGDHTPVLV